MIIRDARILKAICKRYGFEYDPKYKYITKDHNYMGRIFYKDSIYKLKYFSGCFYPYIVKGE